MLHLHLSNRSEQLLQALLALVAESPADPFLPETIVVEAPGMAQWLSWQVAECQGIAANLEFPLPAAFLWRVLRRQLGLEAGAVALSRDSLTWALMATLPSLRGQAGFELVDHYLAGADGETRCYQLSRELAELFDQYLVYRPALIRTWEQGSDPDWQAQLWRNLRAGNRSPHWPDLLEAFRRSMQQQGLQPGVLPPRVSLFAVAALSPGYVDLLQLLARHCELHVFVLNPSREYWGDIESPVILARLRDRWRARGSEDLSAHFTPGNPLLAAMGRPRRDFLDLWLEQEGVVEHDWYRSSGSTSLLGCLQDDILELRTRGSEDEPAHVIEADHSLCILDCYSPLREVEALHDELLALFTRLPQLQPHEIVVLAPDIEVYAPALEAVFSAAPPGRGIPCTIAGAGLQHEPLPELLLAWLRLPTERFAAATVLGWLELDAVQRCLGLEPEDLLLLRDWVAQSAIRWGLDAGHKQSLQLPAEEQNSWDFGLRRLLLGYALPEPAGLYAGVDPCGSVEGSMAPLLGILQQFLEQLSCWRRELAQAATPRVWQQRMNRLIEQFFQPRDEALQQVDAFRQALAQMVQHSDLAGVELPVGAAVVQQYLQQLLQGGGSGTGVMSGRMTCTNLVALRAVPFRVVCILGLNDGVFPRSRRAPGFDRMAAKPCRGDRSLRADDRMLFLEALLSAREALRLSFVGRSQQDSSEYQPSVVVSELMDYLCQGYRLAEGELRTHLWRRQPLQAFSPRAFAAGSHAAEWLQRLPPAAAFSAVALPQAAAAAGSVRLLQLQQFLRTPARHFLEQGLGLRLADSAATLAADEPFAVEGLEAYGLRQAVLDLQIEGADGARILETLRARGGLPPGAAAAPICDTLQAELKPLTRQLMPLLSHSSLVDLDPLRLDLPLSGRIRYVVDGGVLQFRPVKKLKSADLLTAWVEHLALCAMGQQGTACLLGLEEQYRLEPLAQDAARGCLQQLLALLQANLCQVLPLLPQASRAWAEAIHAGKDTSLAWRAARTAWEGSESGHAGAGDRADPWMALAFRDRDPLDERFVALSEQLWLPLLQQLREGDA